MSGHSKWANIKHRKGAQDAKRGKIFTKLIKEITVSVKENGSDLDSNPRLRLAIQNAKGANMPKDTIDRAIKKGSGESGTNYTEVTYEGYGTNGIAIFVECTTDNLNRTVSNVRSLFTKNGGNLGTNGSLEFIFDRKGVFMFPVPEIVDEDDLSLELIDGGVEDIEIEDGLAHVTCLMEDFGNMQRKLDEMVIEPQSAELQRIPTTFVSLDDLAFARAMKLIDALEEDDDVQKVYHNIEATDEQLATI